MRVCIGAADGGIENNYWTDGAVCPILEGRAIASEQRGKQSRSPPMAEPNVTQRKGPVQAAIYHDGKLLVGRHEAAKILSISCRALDYLVANKHLMIRRIGSRVLIPVVDLERYSSSDHPERLAG
jgi:hypothetical protein